MTDHYVVTGCAGFVGSHLSEALLNVGHQVTGIDNFSDYYDRVLKEDNLSKCLASTEFSLLEYDLADGPLEEVFDGVDGVFHLAAQAGVRGSWGTTFDAYARDNVLATQRVFDAAAAEGVRVVWASSSSIYGDAAAYPTYEDCPPSPISPYGVTKLSCEHLAAAYAATFGLDHVILRYFTVYGPHQRPDMAYTRLVRAALDRTVFTVLGDGRQTRDVTYVGDAVDATVRAMTLGESGAAYNVGGGTEASLLEVIAILETLLGEPLKIDHAPVAAGDVRRTCADTSAARAVLEWAPATDLSEGIAAQLAWGRIVGGTDVQPSATAETAERPEAKLGGLLRPGNQVA